MLLRSQAAPEARLRSTSSNCNVENDVSQLQTLATPLIIMISSVFFFFHARRLVDFPKKKKRFFFQMERSCALLPPGQPSFSFTKY
ncbi:MAG TPA: hypothetical protein VGO47_13550, partial [Chlamydiales bacterium]|nr:hypothetical protein [Chlamydiales bacterium]